MTNIKAKRITTTFNPVNDLWDKSLEIKVIYVSNLVKPEQPPVIHKGSVISEDGKSIDYVIQIDIADKYEEKIYNFCMKYFRDSTPHHSMDLSILDLMYRKHVEENSEFVFTLKQIFGYFGVDKLRIKKENEEDVILNIVS